MIAIRLMEEPCVFANLVIGYQASDLYPKMLDVEWIEPIPLAIGVGMGPAVGVEGPPDFHPRLAVSVRSKEKPIKALKLSGNAPI